MADERQLVIGTYILTLTQVRETELMSIHINTYTFFPISTSYSFILTHTYTHTLLVPELFTEY